MSYQPIPVSAGHKIITQNTAPHLDFGLDDKIEIKVNRNAKFEAMRKLFDERDIIYLADFAMLTKYPNKLHNMAKERGWVAITDNNRVVGYRNPTTVNNVIKASSINRQGLTGVIRKLLIEKGSFNVADLVSTGIDRSRIAISICQLRKDGYLIESVMTGTANNGTAVAQYKLIKH